MTTLPLTKRFRFIVLASTLLALLGAGCGIWRDNFHQANRADSAEAEMRLELAVRSLKAASDGSHTTSSSASSTTFDRLGRNEKFRKQMQKNLGDIDQKLISLQTVGRVKGHYYLDLDTLITNVEVARKGQQPLYGSVANTVAGAICLLGQGNTLSLLTWREDIPLSARNNSAYWSQHVSKVSEGFLALNNPWGPVSPISLR